MRLIDLTLPTAEENLALDEALLDEAEDAPLAHETFRLWESPRPFVVVGRNSDVAREVNVPFCRARGIPILRRISGGASVVAGSGSLMYAVVLSYDERPALRGLDEAHRFVLDTTLEAIRGLVPGATRQGTSDLTLDSLKFSGNSLRCKRRAFLYHGTLLYDTQYELIADCLLMPPRAPDYRAGRSHRAFLTNVPVAPSQLRAALIAGWHATPSHDWPRHRVRQLVATRYSHDAWNAHGHFLAGSA